MATPGSVHQSTKLWAVGTDANYAHAIVNFERDSGMTTMTWQATVEDPVVLQKPWVMNPRTIRLNPNPKAEIGR